MAVIHTEQELDIQLAARLILERDEVPDNVVKQWRDELDGAVNDMSDKNEETVYRYAWMNSSLELLISSSQPSGYGKMGVVRLTRENRNGRDWVDIAVYNGAYGSYEYIYQLGTIPGHYMSYSAPIMAKELVATLSKRDDNQ